MANVHNTSETLEQVAEYIEDHGFERCDGNVSGSTFIKDAYAIVIHGDRVSFRIVSNENAQQEFAEYAGFEGISILDFKDWVYLLHIVRMICIQQSISLLKERTGKRIKLNVVQPSTNMVQLVENIFANVKTSFILFFACFTILLASCNTERQVQMQKGTCKITNGRIYFIPATSWNKISFDTTFNGFRVRNTSVRKSKS